jgi:hypothetical protein
LKSICRDNTEVFDYNKGKQPIKKTKIAKCITVGGLDGGG